MAKTIPVTLLSAVAATGAGDSKSAGDFRIDVGLKRVPTGWTVEITTTAAATAVTVALEGSIDGGTTFHTLASHIMLAAELTAKQAMFHVADKGVTDVRANMTTFTQAVAETVTVKAVATF